MKKFICVFLTIALLLCLQPSVIASGNESDMKLVSEKRINTSLDSNQTQVFTFTDAKTVVWSNIPSEDIFNFVYLFIYDYQKLTDEHRQYSKGFNRKDKFGTSFEMQLPTLKNGTYTFRFYASAEWNISPYRQFQATVVVENGKYYFTEYDLNSNEALLQELEDAVQKYLADKFYSGVSIGIVKNGEILFLNFGNTEKDGAGDKVTERTIYEIGSITKTFTATMFADLVNIGKLSLDDKLEKYVGFPVKFKDTDALLRHLATHTSGLPNMNPNKEKTIDVLKRTALATQPGEVYSYSNLGMALLGNVIEKATGKTYEAVLKERIVNKLGMTNTTTKLTETQKQSLAAPYTATGIKLSEQILEDSWIGSGRIKTTALDMTKYILANLGQKPDINKSLKNAITLAQKKHRIIKLADGYSSVGGLGWWYGNNSIVGHTGGTFGYNSAILLSHPLDTGIIVLCNNYAIETGTGAGAGAVYSYDIANLLLEIIKNY